MNLTFAAGQANAIPAGLYLPVPTADLASEPVEEFIGVHVELPTSVIVVVRLRFLLGVCLDFVGTCSKATRYVVYLPLEILSRSFRCHCSFSKNLGRLGEDPCTHHAFAIGPHNLTRCLETLIGLQRRQISPQFRH